MLLQERLKIFTTMNKTLDITGSVLGMAGSMANAWNSANPITGESELLNNINMIGNPQYAAGDPTVLSNQYLTANNVSLPTLQRDNETFADYFGAGLAGMQAGAQLGNSLQGLKSTDYADIDSLQQTAFAKNGGQLYSLGGDLGALIGGPLNVAMLAASGAVKDKQLEQLQNQYYALGQQAKQRNTQLFSTALHDSTNMMFDNKALQMKAYGGPLGYFWDTFDNGVKVIKEGGTHEENPHQGVQQGIAPDGKPNLVEEGEVIYNDYVYSKRLKLSDEESKYFKLGGELSFADAALKLSKESEERPNDPISKKGLQDSMNKLREMQDALKAKNDAKKQKRLQNKLIKELTQLPIEEQQLLQQPQMFAEGGELEDMSQSYSLNNHLQSLVNMLPALSLLVNNVDVSRPAPVTKPSAANLKLVSDYYNSLSTPEELIYTHTLPMPTRYFPELEALRSANEIILGDKYQALEQAKQNMTYAPYVLNLETQPAKNQDVDNTVNTTLQADNVQTNTLVTDKQDDSNSKSKTNEVTKTVMSTPFNVDENGYVTLPSTGWVTEKPTEGQYIMNNGQYYVLPTDFNPQGVYSNLRYYNDGGYWKVVQGGPQSLQIPTMANSFRMAPALGSLIQSMQALSAKPNYQHQDAAIRAASQIPYINYTPIGNYQSFQRVDPNIQANAIKNAYAQALHNMTNVGGSRAATSATQAAALQGLTPALNEALIANTNYNNTLTEKEMANRLGIDSAMLNASLQASQANQQRNTAYATMVGQMAEQKQNIDNILDANKQTTQAGVYQNLGNIGTDMYNRAMQQWMIERGVYPGIAPTKATGGKLKYKTYRKKK